MENIILAAAGVAKQDESWLLLGQLVVGLATVVVVSVGLFVVCFVAWSALETVWRFLGGD